MVKSAPLIARISLSLLLLGAAGAAHATCQLQQAAELHVIVDHNRALAPVEINGQPVLMLVDTGAGSSLLFADAVHRLGVPTHNMSGVIRVFGVGGQAHPLVAEIATLKLADHYAPKNFMMMVVDGGKFQSGKIAGLLGQDIFSGWDIEIDLAKSVIRLIKPVDCKSEQMVYWGAAYAQTPIQSDPSIFVHTTVRARLNDRSIDAYLDTGAQGSVVTLAASREAGLTPGSPKVQQTGVSHGIGAYATPTWTGMFDSFSLGDETIKNAKIRMGDLFAHATHEETGSHVPQREENLPGMLLGADFFLAHHVLISNSHHMVYFSYNGGPVFDTSAPQQPALTTPATVGAKPADGATPPPQVSQSGGHGG